MIPSSAVLGIGLLVVLAGGMLIAHRRACSMHMRASCRIKNDDAPDFPSVSDVACLGIALVLGGLIVCGITLLSIMESRSIVSG